MRKLWIKYHLYYMVWPHRASIAPGWSVIDSMICSHLDGGGKDTCVGDGGGPLFCGEQGSEVCIKTPVYFMLILYLQELVGIVSWIGCHGEGYPDVYTEVTYFVDWIMETMATY